jgi:hypothetical protein
LKNLLFIWFICLLTTQATAQTDSAVSTTGPIDTNKPKTAPQASKKKAIKPVIADTIRKADTLSLIDTTAAATPDTTKVVVIDTLKATTKPRVGKKPIDSFYLKLLDNPYLKTTGKPVYLIISERKVQSKDEMFYLIAGLLLILAFIKLVFNRYFVNIFRLFFQPTFRQKQTREQLLQSSFPSFLMNLFFILSTGAYIAFLMTHYQLTSLHFWWLLLYATLALLAVYTFKFVILTFAGWVFNVKDATDTYVFVVYLINKILGVAIIPFTLLIAFSSAPVIEVATTVSLLLIGLLFIYRYLVSFAPVSRDVKVSPLHFLFYIFAFEVIPLLLIYKTFVLYLNNSLNFV